MKSKRFKTIYIGTDSAIIESEEGEEYHVIKKLISNLNWQTIIHNKETYSLITTNGFYKLGGDHV